MMQLKNCGEYLDVVPHHQVGKYHVWVSGAVLCREPGPGTGTASLELVNYSSLDPNIVSVQWKDWFVSFVTLRPQQTAEVMSGHSFTNLHRSWASLLEPVYQYLVPILSPVTASCSS